MTSKLFSTFVLLIIGLALFNVSCKKDENNPANPSGTNPSPYGSGTVTLSSSAGSFNISGTGVWPIQSGPSVLAMFDTTGAGAFGIGGGLIIAGYQQVSGPNYNAFAIAAVMPPAGVVAGTYSFPNEFGFGAFFNTDTSLFETDSAQYVTVSGSLTISSSSSSSATGTISVMAQKGSGPVIPITGTFTVSYVIGVFPDSLSQLERHPLTSGLLSVNSTKSTVVKSQQIVHMIYDSGERRNPEQYRRRQ